MEKNFTLPKLMITKTISVNYTIEECDSVIGSHKNDFDLGHFKEDLAPNFVSLFGELTEFYTIMGMGSLAHSGQMV